MMSQYGMSNYIRKIVGSYQGMASHRLPSLHDHPILLTDFQVANIMALVECYAMLGKQHSSETRAEWGQIAYSVVHDVLEIVGIKIPRENFMGRQ